LADVVSEFGIVPSTQLQKLGMSHLKSGQEKFAEWSLSSLLKFGILVHYGSPEATNWLKFISGQSKMADVVKIVLKWQCNANCHFLLVY